MIAIGIAAVAAATAASGGDELTGILHDDQSHQRGKVRLSGGLRYSPACCFRRGSSSCVYWRRGDWRVLSVFANASRSNYV